LRYDKYGVPYDTTGLGGRFTGGQSALFVIRNGLQRAYRPGASGGTLTTTESVGKGFHNRQTLLGETIEQFLGRSALLLIAV
jgi:hypothetical protein